MAFLESGDPRGAVNAVIEISYLSNIKYELDKDSGLLCVDRVLYGANYYPANYGFVPDTLSNDGDPADILVLTDYPLQAGSLIKVRLIGVLIMEDEAGLDEKLLSVPISKVDPKFDNITSYEDLPQIMLDRIKDFFENYKNLEKNKWVKVKGYEGVDRACEILESAMEAKK